MSCLVEKLLFGLLWLSVLALLCVAFALPDWLPVGGTAPSFLQALPF